MLCIRNVSKQYAPGVGLLRADLAAAPGSVVALVGPNGSGKTTLLKVLCDVHRPDTGECLLGGVPLALCKGEMGYLPESPYLVDALTGFQFLEFIAGMKGVADFAPAGEMARALHAQEYAGQRLGLLSQGQRKRIAFIAAMIGNPALLILDEPTNGLDTMTLLQMKSVLRDRAGQGKITLLSSHILDFVKNVATEVVFIKNGHTLPREAHIAGIEERYMELFLT